MGKNASKVVEQAKSWLGRNESDGSHKEIIDVYNSHKPLARCYDVKYTDAWCATFVSAVAIKLGYTDIIPTECGCPQMITLFQKLGAWVENENRTPNPGDIIFYDWADNGVGDNLGCADHVGIVEKVSGGVITVIEGNYSNSVKRRTLSVNGRYIRGYGVPKYDKETASVKTASVNLPQLSVGAKGDTVKALQILLIGRGCSCGSYGADGSLGSITYNAVIAFQKANGLVVDGIVGPVTWSKLLGV
jgi:energy-converting hydrogenase Eha subunit B